MNNFVQPGKQIDTVLTADAVSGEVVIKGGLKGIAANDALSGASVPATQEGVFAVKKDAAAAFTQGDSVYYDGAGKEATDDNTDPWIGVCVEDIGAVAGNVKVATGAAAMGLLISNFNATLVKLDADTGVTDADYASTLAV